ncbi:MAG: hypothetical protein K2X81_25625, partial [Candidatus Obscuribacterales bacterium]|nr:hypothetical protein [Candidatus Obscuribacterales bacterium]
MAPENFQETTRRNASQNDETSSRLLQGANSAIDMKASACENTAQGTAETANCWVTAEAEWTQALHGAEKSFTRETPQERAARIDSQNKFSKFQNMESASIDQIYMNEPNRGTLFQPAAAAARSNMVRDRTVELQNLA